MSDKYFIDTNILAYAHDRAAGTKYRRTRSLVEELWNSGGGFLSMQVLQELYINLRRKTARPVAVEEVRQILRDYSTWEMVTNTAESVMQALEIESRYKISFWDALILQEAEKAGVSILYSEDLARGQRYGNIRVVNLLLGP